MPDSNYQSLSARLYGAGVHRYWADRLAAEIQTHFDEIVEDAVAAGQAPETAAAIAMDDIGDCEVLIAYASAQTELLRTGRRLSAWLGYQPAALAVATGSALEGPVSTAAYMRRLSLASICGAAVTAGLIFAMQISLQLS